MNRHAFAQGLVDWYASAYGARRARRYLGACERRGLCLPPDQGRSRSRWPLITALVALLLMLASSGWLGDVAARVLATHRTHTEVHDERH